MKRLFCFKKEITKIYKLKDIQTYVKSTPLSWEIMCIQPLQVNYIIEDNLVIKEIYSVYNHFKKSKVPLHIHVSLINVTDNCFIKFTESDANKLLQNHFNPPDPNSVSEV